MLIELKLNLNIVPTKPARTVLFNFKNIQGRKSFKQLTSETTEFTECFNSMQSLQLQCDKWKNTILSYCKKAFPKIRVRTSKLRLSAADKSIKERNILKKKQEDRTISAGEEVKLIYLEKYISQTVAEEEKSKSYKFKQFCSQNGSVNISEMWKLKNKLWPRHTESSNTGKINHQGKLITGPEDIKKLLAKEFSERLRPRPYHPNFKDIKMIKEEAFEVKLNQAKLNKSLDWNMTDLDIILKNINQNKSRDPEGLNRSIFHENCIGSNLKKSFLVMANKLKQIGFIPKFIKQATISPIPKAG